MLVLSAVKGPGGRKVWRFALGLALLAALLAASACEDDSPGSVLPAGVAEAKSDVDRETAPDVSAASAEQLAADNRAFAADLYGAISGDDGNLIFSPYSISAALAMTYAGARDKTEEEMAAALRWTLSQDDLHPAFNMLDIALSSRGSGSTPDPLMGDAEGDYLRLRIANSIWGQVGFEFLQEYLDTLARNYGAGLRLVDFGSSAEAARQAINDWVSEQTEDRINDLVPADAIDEFTRLVLTNAIYFNASWLTPFDVEDTADGRFHLSNGDEVTVPMMHTVLRTGYAEVDSVQAVFLPYFGGDTEFVLLLPEEGKLEGFEDSLDGEEIDLILDGRSPHDVTLAMPKFEFESQIGLKDALMSLGMDLAFDPGQADFTGISEGADDLYVSDAVHKAFIAVDEMGTEAAASTAVFMSVTNSFPSAEVTADRPFLFLIRDVPTDTILFMGRVANPSS